MRSHGENGLQSNWKISYPQRVFKTVNATIPLYPIRSRCSTSRSTTGTSLTFPGREESLWVQWRAALLFSIPTHFMRCFRGNCMKLCLQYHKNWEPKMTWSKKNISGTSPTPWCSWPTNFMLRKIEANEAMPEWTQNAKGKARAWPSTCHRHLWWIKRQCLGLQTIRASVHDVDKLDKTIEYNIYYMIL